MDKLSALEARVAALEAALAQLSDRVVTRRVVVTDATGVERVVVSTDMGTASVLVRLDRPPGRTTGIELFAGDHEDEEPSIGIARLEEGEVAASYVVRPGDR